MKNQFLSTLLLLIFSPLVFAQGVYGVFSLPPATNFGEKQIGTINPADGSIGLLGTNTSVETGALAMTTGATALNVNGNKSYFIARDTNGDSRIYTVDLSTGITDTDPILSGSYTTDNNWGVWYDEPDGVLYALFNDVNGSGTIELTSINTTTGVVTQQHNDVTNGDGAGGLGSGLMTGDSANDRVFTLINGNLYVISTSTANTSWFFEVSGEINGALNTSSVFGLEWHKDTGTIWFLYNQDNVNGDRQLMEVIGDDNFNEFDELFQVNNIEIDFGDAILTSSGLAALDTQSNIFFFIGRPSTGANANKWSLYSVDLPNQTSSNADIENAAQVQTNGYAGIEVLPGPELSLGKTDGDVSAVPGDTITYTLNYANAAGAGATSGLTITETVPAETTFLSGSSTAGWNCLPDDTAGSVCTISPGELGPGGNASVTFAVQVDTYVTAALTEISNTSTLAATNALNDVMASDTTPITASAVLAISKTDNDLTSAVPGDTVAYDITVDNSGDRIASNAVITETVPANTTYIPTVPFTWNCVPDNTAGSTCTTSPVDLGAQGIATTFHVQIDSSVPAGTTEISNQASVSADNAATMMAADTTPVTSAAVLAVSKSDGDADAIPGQAVIYQIDYANNGNQDAANTTLTETVLPNTTFDGVNSTGGWVCAPDNNPGSTCTASLGTLGGNVMSAVNFALLVDTPVPTDLTVLNNDVTLSADNAASTNAQDSTPVVADADFNLVKADGGITAGLDKVINYTLIAFNNGDRDAADATLTETVPDNTTFYPPASTAGWSCVPDNNAGSSCQFDLGTLAGGGTKVNTFFAVRVDESLGGGVTELTNTASIAGSNTTSSDQDTVMTPVDSQIPVITLIDADPSITEITSCSQNRPAINGLFVSFLDDNPGLIGVDDPANFALIDTGPDQDLQSTSCGVVAGDDALVTFQNFITGGTATAPNVTMTLSDNLPNGQYVLQICDAITDAAGNAIDGDNSGLQGGDLWRQFRVDTENLLANAYIDDCADNPASLLGWTTFTNPGDTISATTAQDSDDSSLSGSVYLQGGSGSDMGIEQCTNLDAFGSHTFSMDARGVSSQVQDIDVLMTCAFFDSTDCTGSLLGDRSASFMLPPANPASWDAYSSLMLIPDGSASAACTMAMVEPVNSLFEAYADALRLIYSDLIFGNGFDD
jgi:uncharacterized repeat protein (TIGR01451 family)